MKWRVQASWDYGRERRSYAPFWVDTKAEALASADEVSEMLSHFPGLEVSVRLVPDEEALHEGEQQQRQAFPTVHLATVEGGAHCGASLTYQHALLAPELFELSTGRRCERCLERQA